MRSSHFLDADHGICCRLVCILVDFRRSREICIRFVVSAVLIILSFTTTAYARQESKGYRYLQDIWTTKEGLPQNSVNDIVQTNDGFLWLATYDGLAQFDGEVFEVFRTSNTPGFPSNRVTSLLQSKEGDLWIGTEGGLARYRNGRFNSYMRADGLPDDYINDIVQDAIGRIWVSTGSSSSHLSRLDGDRFVSALASDADTPTSNFLYADWDGAVWAAERRRVVRLRGDDQTVFELPGWISGDIVRQVNEDSDGAIWVGTGRGNVYRLESGRMKLQVRLELPSGEIERYMFTDGLRSMWTATTGGSQLYVGGALVTEVESTAKGAPGIGAIVEDNEGNIWIGTNGSGLVKLSRSIFRVYTRSEGLTNEIALSVTQTADGTVWAGTNCGGVYRIRDGRASRFDDPGVPRNACIYSVLGASDGSLWVGHRSLVHYKNGRRESFAQAQGLAQNPSNRSDFIIALYEDPEEKDVLWVGTQDGLHRFDGKTFRRYGIEDGLPDINVRGLIKSSSGALWIATRGGLTRFDGVHFVNYTVEDGLSSIDVRALHFDSSGTLWIGTYGGGLMRYKDGVFSHIGSEDGLFDDVVSSILESDGRFWMSGNKGIHTALIEELNDFIDGKRDDVPSVGYQQAAGLPNPETNGRFQPAAWKGLDGTLWFPTLGGVASVNPRDVVRDSYAPVVHIQEVHLRGKKIDFNNGVSFDANNRNFEIKYTGINFTAPGRLVFQYKLEGFDPGWQEVGSRRVAIYTNVNAGSFTFKVRAVNRDGIWSTDSATLAVSVAPYFYERKEFFIFVIFLLFGIAFGTLAWRKHEIRVREEKLNRLITERTNELQEALSTVEVQAEQLQELDIVKTRFFANTSHEFRTPLTLILGPLKQILVGDHGDVSNELREQLTLIQRNGNRLLNLINQLLELGKIDAGGIQIKAVSMDIIPFTREHVALFESIAALRDLDLQFHSRFEELLSVFDPDMLDKVIVNLIANAIKFTPPGGAITVTVDQSEDASICIDVTDSGGGIDAEDLHRLFDRFYQSSANDERSGVGSGIGLALSRELVLLHGGELTVSNEEGGGAVFTVVIPPGLSIASGATEVNHDWNLTPGLLSEANDEFEAEEAHDETELILVVEDNADLRAHLRATLRGYRTVEADNGVRGYDAALEHIPDLIISDVMMPEKDGFELCRDLKTDHRTSHIPVILLTARADRESKIEGLETGADDYLSKPFEGDELIARVRNLIEQRRLLRERFGGLFSPEEVQIDTDLPERERTFLQQINESVRDHMDDHGFGVDDLAEEIHMSRRQLSRKLKALVNESPGEIIRRLRLEEAARLLNAGDLSIQQISSCVGYRSASYFSRAFSDQFGVTPRHFGKDASIESETENVA